MAKVTISNFPFKNQQQDLRMHPPSLPPPRKSLIPIQIKEKRFFFYAINNTGAAERFQKLKRKFGEKMSIFARFINFH